MSDIPIIGKKPDPMQDIAGHQAVITEALKKREALFTHAALACIGTTAMCLEQHATANGIKPEVARMMGMSLLQQLQAITTRAFAETVDDTQQIN